MSSASSWCSGSTSFSPSNCSSSSVCLRCRPGTGCSRRRPGSRSGRCSRPFLVIAGGLVLASAGLMVLSQLTGLAGIALGSVAFSLGLAPVPTLSTALIVGSAPPERAGAASGIAETSSELGGALGIALLGSLGTAVYRQNLGGAFPVEADTLAGAVALAAKLPDPAASALLAASR